VRAGLGVTLVRKVVHGGCLLGVAVTVAACAPVAGGRPAATVTGGDLGVASVDGARSGAGPLGLLPIPAGATPWTSNTNAPMALVPFSKAFFSPSAVATEESLYTRRGFVTGGREGWINSDGTQQEIVIARFSTENGAISAWDGLSSGLADKPSPWTVFADSAVGGVGAVNLHWTHSETPWSISLPGSATI